VRVAPTPRRPVRHRRARPRVGYAQAAAKLVAQAKRRFARPGRSENAQTVTSHAPADNKPHACANRIDVGSNRVPAAGLSLPGASERAADPRAAHCGDPARELVLSGHSTPARAWRSGPPSHRGGLAQTLHDAGPARSGTSRNLLTFSRFDLLRSVPRANEGSGEASASASRRRLARGLRAGTRESIDAGPRGLHMTANECKAFALSEK
jgi:hypothetical protein